MCDFITTGRTEPCKDSVGGIDAVYFLDRDSIANFNIDSNGVLTAVTSVGPEIQQFLNIKLEEILLTQKTFNQVEKTELLYLNKYLN